MLFSHVSDPTVLELRPLAVFGYGGGLPGGMRDGVMVVFLRGQSSRGLVGPRVSYSMVTGVA